MGPLSRRKGNAENCIFVGFLTEDEIGRACNTHGEEKCLRGYGGERSHMEN
jgi:hypothetical protein